MQHKIAQTGYAHENLKIFVTPPRYKLLMISTQAKVLVPRSFRTKRRIIVAFPQEEQKQSDVIMNCSTQDTKYRLSQAIRIHGCEIRKDLPLNS